MARIRSIKPEFWTDEKIVELSAFARLLFIGLWNFADDEGRMVYSEKRLKMQIFPADPVELSELIGEIRRESLVTVYAVDGIEYLQIKGFAKHQKVDRRSPSKLPPPPASPPISPEPPRIPPTDQGRDQGREGIKEGSFTAPAAPSPDGEGYAWSGRIIRLSRRDYDRWRESYPNVEIDAELQAADDYYADKAPKNGWFFAVSNWLKRANAQARGSPGEAAPDNGADRF
jgi:hypothetical protein